jgi:hypothetical protein
VALQSIRQWRSGIQGTCIYMRLLACNLSTVRIYSLIPTLLSVLMAMAYRYREDYIRVVSHWGRYTPQFPSFSSFFSNIFCLSQQNHHLPSCQSDIFRFRPFPARFLQILSVWNHGLLLQQGQLGYGDADRRDHHAVYRHPDAAPHFSPHPRRPAQSPQHYPSTPSSRGHRTPRGRGHRCLRRWFLQASAVRTSAGIPIRQIILTMGRSFERRWGRASSRTRLRTAESHQLLHPPAAPTLGLPPIATCRPSTTSSSRTSGRAGRRCRRHPTTPRDRTNHRARDGEGEWRSPPPGSRH